MNQERFNKLRELSEVVVKMEHFADPMEQVILLDKIWDMRMKMMEAEGQEIITSIKYFREKQNELLG